MTYARARLWLGITSVGLLVTASIAAIVWQVPYRLLPTDDVWHFADLTSLLVFLAAFCLLMLPLDILGGWLLPRKFERSSSSFGTFVREWISGVAVQSSFFLVTSLLILAAGRFGGVALALATILLLMLASVAVQGNLARLLVGPEVADPKQLAAALQRLRRWGIQPLATVVVQHRDPGFTGGVVGFPGREVNIIPAAWSERFTVDQLAVILARRTVAVRTGSRTRGLLGSMLWVTAGAVLALLAPRGGAASVAALVTTCCVFTCWSFVGLLVLPTSSRRASLTIDQRVREVGIPADLLDAAIVSQDQLQDDEPQRPALVETIFHPVPSVANRRGNANSLGGAWHIARTTLYLSWSCLGLLSRAVHCNAGRPELWVLLPTD